MLFFIKIYAKIPRRDCMHTLHTPLGTSALLRFIHRTAPGLCPSLYCAALFLRAMTTLWITRNKHSIAAMVIPVHHASSSPAEDTIF